jgi:hypothetical protein
MALSLLRWQHLEWDGAGSAVRVRRGHRSRCAKAIVDGVIVLEVATPWVWGRRKHGLSSSRASLEMREGHCGWRHCARGGNTLGVGAQKARSEFVEGIARETRKPLQTASLFLGWQHLGHSDAGSAVQVRRGHRMRCARAIADGVIVYGVATPWARRRRKRGLSSSKASFEMREGHCGWRRCTWGGNTLGVEAQEARFDLITGIA